MGFGSSFATSGNALTLASPTAGAGALVKIGAGSPVLTGTNSYTSGTPVSVDLGLNAQIGASTSIYARYDGEITGRDDAHAISDGLRMTW